MTFFSKNIITNYPKMKIPENGIFQMKSRWFFLCIFKCVWILFCSLPEYTPTNYRFHVPVCTPVIIPGHLELVTSHHTYFWAYTLPTVMWEMESLIGKKICINTAEKQQRCCCWEQHHWEPASLLGVTATPDSNSKPSPGKFPAVEVSRSSTLKEENKITQPSSF